MDEIMILDSFLLALILVMMSEPVTQIKIDQIESNEF